MHKFLDSEDVAGLRLNVAGVTCHAWSAEGLNEGSAHESEIPLAVWLAERVSMFESKSEDVAFVECTPRFPAQERLTQVFGELADVFAWTDGPEWHGWPHRRRRILAVVVNRLTASWVGETDLSLLKEDYGKRFYRQMVAAGDKLMQASEQDRIDEMTVLAVARKNNVTSAQDAALIAAGDLESLATLMLPPGGIQRLRDWQDVYHDKLQERPKLRAFLCDVDHAVGGKGKV